MKQRAEKKDWERPSGDALGTVEDEKPSGDALGTVEEGRTSGDALGTLEMCRKQCFAWRGA